MIVRQEATGDLDAVRSITTAAFSSGDGSEPAETRLLDGLRDCSGWIPAMSLVATIDDAIVGHAVCTRGHVDDVTCVALGPISVTPTLQHAGVGSALMHTMIGVAAGAREPLIALLGSRDYYPRFGFVPSANFGIRPPDEAWGEFFQVRTLDAYDRTVTGVFTYAEPFAQL